MTYPTYTHQQLRFKSLAQLKHIHSEIGCTAYVMDKRSLDAWMSAIARYQSAQLQKKAEVQGAGCKGEMEVLSPLSLRTSAPLFLPSPHLPAPCSLSSSFRPASDEQAIAQGELNQYIAIQAPNCLIGIQSLKLKYRETFLMLID
ncbi:hypothetical protein [Dendronalium sp. ChiSLP03b]|uniref:hypothetical protein n=1 Tax=Dendronalium sp. ChiSLP03b TaxID=3075381 RepID=UPI00391958A6